jgi:dihydrofolate synthase/folylpolyglutamate synthase
MRLLYNDDIKMNDIEVAYQAALDYIYRFVDYSLTRNLGNIADKFDLSRMRILMERLGNPQNQFAVVHVAGTKGKGSVSAMIASALHAAGYCTGFYTSPHLVEFTERMQVDGQKISRAEFVTLIAEIKQHVRSEDQLTTFELTTALAFLFFARREVRVAVVEVGLGGRLDATNVVSPLVSVITSLSYDHMNVLGNTLEQIAGEKAGIIKLGRPVVLAPQKEEARQVVEQVAAEHNARLVQVGREFFYSPINHSLDGQSMLVWSAEEQPLVDAYIESGGRDNWEPFRLNIPLLGYHQVENAATAYAALQVVRAEGLAISEQAIRQGFQQVKWPGRFEVLSLHPLVIVDSAHNRDSALKLRLTLEDYLPERPVVLIFGASEDKDISGMFAELLPRVWQVVATQSNHPRALEAEKLVELAHRFGRKARVVVPVEAALKQALELAGDEALVLACGSLFVAAAVRETWLRMTQESM